MSVSPATRLTNLQLELLHLFAREVEENDVIEIKKMLLQYFVQKSMKIAEEAWDKNGWTAEDEDKMLNEHLRTPYLKRP
jgi:hypothetical protein